MRRNTIALTVLALMLLFAAISTSEGHTASDLSPGDHNLSIEAGGRTRTFILHVPPAFDGRRNLAAVIMIHGAGGSGAGAMLETGWDRLADREGFLAAFPDGTPALPGAPASFLLNPRLWNDGSGRGAIGRNDVNDIAFFYAMIEMLEERYRADPNRIFVTGFSNGASMTWRLGVELSSMIAAIAPVSGHLWVRDVTLSAPMPAMFIVGTADPLHPMAGGNVKLPWGSSQYHPPVERSLARWRAALGCGDKARVARDGDGVREQIWDQCARGGELDYLTIEGQGHIWPGGVNELPERWVGKPTNHLDATSTIWAFFKAHPKTQR